MHIVQGLNNTFDLFQPNIEQLIQNSIDWKFCRGGNNQINLCSPSFNIQQFKSLYRLISSTDPPLCQNDERPKRQPTHLIHTPIHLKLWNFAESVTIRSISTCLLSIYAMRYLVVKECERMNSSKNEQTKEWTYQWTNELMNECLQTNHSYL